MDDNPKISIVTVTYNASNCLEDTLLSVSSQEYSNIEYILIDGGSTDGTLDIIEKYRTKINFVLSEPDKGIYDAMNKGIRYCTGEWIIFMNAGDHFFASDTLKRIFTDYDLNACGIIYGNHEVRYKNNHVIKYPLPLSLLWKRMTIQHQSIFVKAQILKNKNFDISYRFAADYDHFFYCYKNNYSFRYIDLIISSISAFGFSESNSVSTYKEYRDIAIKYSENHNRVKNYHKVLIFQRQIIAYIKKIFPVLNYWRNLNTIFNGKR